METGQPKAALKQKLHTDSFIKLKNLKKDGIVCILIKTQDLKLRVGVRAHQYGKCSNRCYPCNKN
jgi:hypothetical protein